MCSALTPDCEYDKSTNIFIGDVYSPYTKCSGKLCLQKKTFQPLSRSDYQSPQCEFVYQVRNNPFEDQTNSFFCRLEKGFKFLKKVQNQSKLILQMCMVLANFDPTERNANLLAVS